MDLIGLQAVNFLSEYLVIVALEVKPTLNGLRNDSFL